MAKSGKADGKETESVTCHLLRIPIEIRLEIYRYLFLPTPNIRARLTPHSHASDLEESSEEVWIDESEGENEDEDDSDRDSLLSMMMYNFDEEFDTDTDSDESTDGGLFEKEHIIRDFAILRSNRQIHSEASSLWYSEAILTLQPADVFCLAKNSDKLGFGFAGEMIWKHDPLKGIGKTDRSGTIIYGPPWFEDAGDIEPHIIAKFQKIFFDAHFDEEDTDMVFWIDDDTYVIREDDANRFKDQLDSSILFKYLAKILSNSPRITNLEIKIEIDIISESKLILEDGNLDDTSDETEEEEFERDMKIDRIEDIANFKVTELFVESKVMDPLLKLRNVANCMIKFGFENLGRDYPWKGAKPYEPQTLHVQMLKHMKDTIEGNFQELDDMSLWQLKNARFAA